MQHAHIHEYTLQLHQFSSTLPVSTEVSEAMNGLLLTFHCDCGKKPVHLFTSSLVSGGVSAPSLQARLWGAPSQKKKRRSSLNGEKLLSRPTQLRLRETLAESVYIGRPLVHCILPSLSLQSTRLQYIV